MSNAEKVSKPRPFNIIQQEYDTRWDAIFGRDIQNEDTKQDGKVNDESRSNNTDNRKQTSN
jgi:hypothetical protein